MKDFLMRAFALTFTAGIHKLLDAPKAIGMGIPIRSCLEALRSPTAVYRAEGQLPLRTHSESGETSAPVIILVHPNWMDRPPKAFSSADFIRHEVDWHVQADGSLCHVLPHQWSWQLDQWWQQGADMSQVADSAAGWCCRNLDSLITRHLHGHRFGLTKWPKLWGQWSHYQEGIDEFRNSLNTTSKAA